MRVNINMLTILGGFFALLATVYSVWALITYGRVEWVGTLALALTAVLSLFIGFYLSRSFKSQGGQLPEDRLDAAIDDGDPELGFFSPYSWWPLVLGISAALAFVGLVIGIWMFAIALSLFIVAIVGWVYEYYRGYHAR